MRKNTYENAAWEAQKCVVGLDEVGRGCLAGPLVTGAVILPIGKTHRLLKDSKLMTPEERMRAYGWITQHCRYSVGIVHNRIIDQHNIWHATLIAMQKALMQLLVTVPEKPVAILTDAMPIRLFDTAYKDLPVYSFAKGEKYSSSIAAASIVAKVTRDYMMQRLDPVFPGYKFAQHKGYSTKTHQDAICELGSSIVHRKSFLGKVLACDAGEEQQRCF